MYNIEISGKNKVAVFGKPYHYDVRFVWDFVKILLLDTVYIITNVPDVIHSH